MSSTPMEHQEDVSIQKSVVEHSHDEEAKSNFELLEMKRLGLPISFGGNVARKNMKRSQPSHNLALLGNDEDSFDPSNEQPHLNLELLETKCSDVAIQKNNKRSRAKHFSDSHDLDNVHVPPVIVPELVNQISSISIGSVSAGGHDEEHVVDEEMNEEEEEVDEEVELPANGTLKINKKSPRKRRKKKSKRHNNNKPNLVPYWNQRYVLFSLFNRGIKLDRESWYSVTPEPIARHIALRMEKALNMHSRGRKHVIIDGFCGAGGNIIQFALLPSVQLVLAVDISAEKLALARHNATIYGCAHKIEFIQADFLRLIRGPAGERLAKMVDACFLSPPWGGPDYRSMERYSLECMTPNGFEIARLVGKYLTKNVSFLLPRNFDQDELEPLTQAINNGTSDQNVYVKVELEENRIFTKVKMMTAYFGKLVLEDFDDIDDADVLPQQQPNVL